MILTFVVPPNDRLALTCCMVRKPVSCTSVQNLYYTYKRTCLPICYHIVYIHVHIYTEATNSCGL